MLRVYRSSLWTIEVRWVRTPNPEPAFSPKVFGCLPFEAVVFQVAAHGLTLKLHFHCSVVKVLATFTLVSCTLDRMASLLARLAAQSGWQKPHIPNLNPGKLKIFS